MQDSAQTGDPSVHYNLMRQKLGPKGAATRQRILDTIVRLVDVQTGELPSITQICRATLVSKATFYQYFVDFNAVVAELLHPVAQATEQLAAMLAEPWPDDRLYERSHAFVAAMFDRWDRHRVPLRLRNLLADAGDKAMIEAKIGSIDPMIRALAAKLCAARGGEPVSGEDHAQAIILLGAISQAAMIITHNVYPVAIEDAITKIHGYTGNYQHRALAHLLATALRNPALPGGEGGAGARVGAESFTR